MNEPSQHDCRQAAEPIGTQPRAEDADNDQLHQARRLGRVPNGEIACPNCGSRKVVPIIYGLPTRSTENRARKGLVELGGCIVGLHDPDLRCHRCRYRWKGVSEQATATAKHQSLRGKPPETLLTDLRSNTDRLARRCAAWALGESGDTSASVVEGLLGALATDSDSSVRQAALWALEELKDARPAVIDGVLRALAFDKAWPVRRSAIWVLRTLGDTTFAVVEGLVRALTTDTDETVRRKAIEMLRDIRAISPLAVPGLLWAVGTEKVTSIRYAVFDVLVNCEGDRSPVIDGLFRILRTSDSFPMREKAAVALRDAESSPAVIDALLHAVTTDINVSVRRRAASSLAAHAVSSARAFDVLLEALITVEDGRAWEDAARFLRTTLPTLTAAKRSSVEAVVARMESASQVEGKHCGQCPRCGWSYAWNGSVCGHCNFRLQ